MDINKIICWYKSDGFFWIRIFGHGLAIKDITKHRKLFSERYGYTKLYKIHNNYHLKFLKREEIFWFYKKNSLPLLG